MFVDAIHAREDGRERNMQSIVESHSEHFLRRLQRRIAEEALIPEESAVYFVCTDGASARLRELEVDRFGNIKEWPANFFGDEMADLVARSEAQARRVSAAVGAGEGSVSLPRGESRQSTGRRWVELRLLSPPSESPRPLAGRGLGWAG